MGDHAPTFGEASVFILIHESESNLPNVVTLSQYGLFKADDSLYEKMLAPQWWHMLTSKI